MPEENPSYILFHKMTTLHDVIAGEHISPSRNGKTSASHVLYLQIMLNVYTAFIVKTSEVIHE